MKKWIAGMLILSVLLFGSVLGFNFFKQQKVAEFMANMPAPKLPVEVIEVETSDWQPVISSIGFIEPEQGVQMTSTTTGRVTGIFFESGEAVKKGQLMLEQDSAVEQANLDAVKSRLPAAKSTYERNLQLFQRKSVSQAALDESQATYFAMRSEIASLQATIDRRQIRAPFDGITGLRDIHQGQLIQPGTEITRLENIDNMKVRFSVPQKDLSALAITMPLTILTDAYPGRVFVGSITAIDSAISADSGVVQVQASIPNSEGLLRSGMYATLEIAQPVLKDSLIVPTQAINFGLYGEQVYVLKESRDEEGNEILTVEQRQIKVDERRESYSRVSSGLEPHEKVVTSGQVRLRNGAQVRLVEDKVLSQQDGESSESES